MNGSERAVAQPLQERTCLVTGATSGIGLETAAALASAGATVLLWALGQSLTGATWPSPPDCGNAEAPTSPGIAVAHGQRRHARD